MNDLAEVWHFTRTRLAQAIDGLNDVQMNWRPFEGGHTIFEYLYHIAGAEHYWAARLCNHDPAATDLEAKLDRAIFDGFLREGACPFSPDEMNRELTFSVL